MADMSKHLTLANSGENVMQSVLGSEGKKKPLTVNSARKSFHVTRGKPEKIRHSPSQIKEGKYLPVVCARKRLTLGKS